MKFIKFKISRECIFPLDNTAHVCLCKFFYHISAHFRNPGFCSVSKARKPVFNFRTSPTTMVYHPKPLGPIITESYKHF